MTEGVTHYFYEPSGMKKKHGTRFMMTTYTPEALERLGLLEETPLFKENMKTLEDEAKETGQSVEETFEGFGMCMSYNQWKRHEYITGMCRENILKGYHDKQRDTFAYYFTQYQNDGHPLGRQRAIQERDEIIKKKKAMDKEVAELENSPTAIDIMKKENKKLKEDNKKLRELFGGLLTDDQKDELDGEGLMNPEDVIHSLEDYAKRIRGFLKQRDDYKEQIEDNESVDDAEEVFFSMYGSLDRWGIMEDGTPKFMEMWRIIEKKFDVRDKIINDLTENDEDRKKVFQSMVSMLPEKEIYETFDIDTYGDLSGIKLSDMWSLIDCKFKLFKKYEDMIEAVWLELYEKDKYSCETSWKDMAELTNYERNLTTIKELSKSINPS